MSMQATHLVVLSAKPASSRALSTTPSYSSTQAHSSPPLRSIHLFELLPVRSQQRQHHHLILGGESLRSNESRGTTEWPGLEGGGCACILELLRKVVARVVVVPALFPEVLGLAAAALLLLRRLGLLLGPVCVRVT